MNDSSDAQHWLYRHDAPTWIRMGLAEVARADEVLARGDRRAGLALCRRAAGMGVNAWLALMPDLPERYGRSFMDHLFALSEEESAPQPVRAAALALHRTPLPGGQLALLRTPKTELNWTEAARDVLAWAYGFVVKQSHR